MQKLARRGALFSFIVLVSAVIPGLSAAPNIAALVNAASNTPAGLPNAPLAQGSIFVIYGTGLGPANISFASPAFQSASLGGTSVAITVGTTTVNALMYYASATQVAALLPSNTPTGTGTFTVTFNGQVSNSALHGITANNLAIFTIDQSGQGAGVITYPDYSLVSSTKSNPCGGPNTSCGAANPGDTLILWATGLGPVSGSDSSGAGLGQDMTGVPITVWLGGVQAPVVYRGRSGCCIGEDQIVFTVPNNAPAGCAIPLLVQINGEISNNVLMPIAKGSRDCTPVDPTLGTAASLAQLLVAGPVALGEVELDHFANDTGPGFHDVAQFNFFKFSQPAAIAPYAATFFDHQPLGTCLARPTLRGDNANLGTLTPLDAGSNFTIKGPNGSITVTAQTGDKPSLSGAGAFLVPGSYTITGNGGKDVGPFTANLTVPVPPIITSPVSSGGLTVSRSAGMTITWNPNGSTGHVELILGSALSNSTTTASVTCTVPANAGTFTIPPNMLLSLPNGNSTIFFFQLGDQGPATVLPFSANGLTVGIAQTFIDGTSFGGFTITN